MNDAGAAPYRESAASRAPRMPLVVAAFLIAWLGTLLVQWHMLVPTIFIGTGIMLAAGYIFKGPAGHVMVAALAGAEALGALAAGLPVAAAAVPAGVAGLQAAVGAVVLRRLAPGGLDLTRARSIVDLGLVAILVAPPFGLLVEWVLMRTMAVLVENGAEAVGPYTVNLASPLAQWILPCALGIVLTTPICLSFYSGARRSAAELARWRRLGALGLTALATVVVFLGRDYTFIFYLAPVLVWVAMRRGIRDTAAAVVVSLLIGSALLAAGHGPGDVMRLEPSVRPFFVEVAYLCCYGSILPIAASLESRRRLERELASSLDFSGQILANMHEVVFRTDARGRWTFLNPAWEVLSGESVEESVGRDASELLTPNTSNEALAEMRRLIAGEIEDLRLQRSLRRADGAMRDLVIHIRAIRDAEGEFAGASGSIRDVSDHLRYVAALKASEQRFRQLCDSSPVGILRCDRSGVITYVNQRIELIVMAEMQRIVGQPWSEVLGLRNLEFWESLNRTLITPGAVFEHQLEFRDQAGLKRWLTFSATGEFDDSSKVIGYIAAVTDITQRKAFEAELARTTRELQLVTENINDMIFRLDLEGRCLYVTPSVREVLGHEPRHVVGAFMLGRLHSDDKASVVAGFGRLAAGEIDQMTISYRSRPAPPREGYIWLEANCRLLRDWKDQPYEIVAALRDVTERKQLEFALIEARERAEQAVAVKSEFLAHLSHEIRTPMNGVLGLADLLLERPLDDVGRSYVRLISESGETMMKLLNDILDIAKVDAGRLQLASETFDLHDCLAKSLSLMTASAVRKGLALELVMADDVPRRIVGDSLRLRQILANLIGNAVKFTESGHVRLEAAVEPGAESEAAGGGAGTLVIAVEDSGIGIAEGLQARVFDEFTQADAGTADSFGGTGLGLAISRRLAEAFGGTLTLTSIPGKGTRLILRMPLLLPGAEIALPALAPAAVDRPTMAPLHLLVAEDNRTNQLIIGAMLERLGHSCVMVARGDAVLDEVRAAKASGRCFDAVLMDLLMPGMDGREATHALRQAGHGPADLPIIAVTANGFAQDIEACRAAGMQGHLVKPVRIDALAAELARIVDAARTVHAA